MAKSSPRSSLERLFTNTHDMRHALRSKCHVRIFSRSNAPSSAAPFSPKPRAPPLPASPTSFETASTAETLIAADYTPSSPAKVACPRGTAIMLEYVWALHEFQPEAEDEIPFVAGEKIEVIEKDEEYGDGWWQGKNASGKQGLFPQSYTTSIPPPSASDADTSATPRPSIGAAVIPPVNGADDSPEQQPQHELEHSSSSTALESLEEESEPPTPAPGHSPIIPGTGINGQKHVVEHDDGDGEMMQATITDVQKAIEQLGRERRGSVNTYPSADAQSFSFASDTGESTDLGEDSDADRDSGEAEGGETWHRDARLRLAEKARLAVEQAEKLESMMSTRSAAPPIEVELSDESDMEDEDGDDDNQNYTASSFARRHSRIPEEDEDDLDSPMYKPPVSQLPPIEEPEAEQPAERAQTPGNDIIVPPPVFSSLPTPAASESNTGSHTGSSSPTPVPAFATPQALEARSLTAPEPLSTPTPPAASPKPSELPKGEPSSWNVIEVVQWLRYKGFGEDVCEKFTEQEITGDVLQDLDVNLLKNEIGIMAYGKRVRIAHAITDLRRPPSVTNSTSASNSDRQAPSPLLAPTNALSNAYPQSPKSLTYSYHSRSQSLSQSLNRSSLGGQFSPVSPENGQGDASSAKGLGIEGLPGTRRLSASPSEGNLVASATDGDLGATEKIAQDEDERGAFSEGETATINKKRRLFGGGSPRNSKDGKLTPSPTTENLRQARPKKSPDVGGSSKGSGDRLSIFGTSLGGRKARKPAPRYSSAEDTTLSDSKEKEKSGSGFLRFGGSSKSKSGRPSTAEGGTPSKSFSHSSSADLRQRSVSNLESLSPTSGRANEDGSLSKKDPQRLRKRTSSYPGSNSASSPRSAEGPSPSTPTREGMAEETMLQPGKSVLKQIGESDHSGWMLKRGDRYNSWKSRYFVLKGQHLYCLKSSSTAETKIKGYVNILGYRVTVDETLNPGKYGFRIEHDQDKTHYFSHDDKVVMRDWMKAIMKATIGRDYTRPVISSVNISTIPLVVAQAMNPAPRPPSPTQRAATQKAMRRENPNQLSSRDARVLMGISNEDGKERAKLDNVFTESQVDSGSSIGPTTPRSATTPKATSINMVPPRPSREQRRNSEASTVNDFPVDDNLISWANDHLPSHLQLTDSSKGPLFGGLSLLRLAESIKGRPSEPPVPDSLFPSDGNDDKLDGLFKLFDFLLDNDVKMGSLSINDIRQGRRDKVAQLLKALKTWEDKRKTLAGNIGKSGYNAAGFIAAY